MNDLETSFIDTFGPQTLPKVSLKSFSYRESVEDSLTIALKILLPVFLIFSTFYTANNIIKVSFID